MNKLRFLPSPSIHLALWKQILSAEGIPGNGHPSNYIYGHPNNYIYGHPNNYIYGHPNNYIYGHSNNYIYGHPNNYIYGHPNYYIYGRPNNYIYEIFPTQAKVQNFVSKEKTKVNRNNAQLSAKDTFLSKTIRAEENLSHMPYKRAPKIKSNKKYLLKVPSCQIRSARE
jgi:hypothetical protein